MPASPLSEWWRVLVMGGVLAALTYTVFFLDLSTKTGSPAEIEPALRIEVVTPDIDYELLRTADDSSRQQRLIIEPEPLAHLLETSLNVVPTVAEALGLPEDPIDVALLRASPAAYRGAYLGYRGRLEYLSPPKSGHPVPGFKIHEGWIVADDGEKILFRVSVPPKDVQIGDYVRVEGFFLKLRDSHRRPEATEAPLLVGPELFRDFPNWDPVEALDPEILEQIVDGELVNGELIDDLSLEDSQELPLWHLAGYALERDRKMSFAAWREVPALVSVEDYKEFHDDRMPRGRPMRLLGRFIYGQSLAARPNPLGIEHWTQAWVQIRLQGKLIPVWTPTRLSDLAFNDDMEIRGYFYRRMVYDTEKGIRETPLFVAAKLDRYADLPESATVGYVRIGFFLLVLFVIGLFFWVARRDGKRRDRHEEEMIDRRRRRQGRPPRQPKLEPATDSGVTSPTEV